MKWLSIFQWYRKRKGGTWCLFYVEPVHDILDLAFKKWVHVELDYDPKLALTYYEPPLRHVHELLDTERYDDPLKDSPA